VGCILGAPLRIDPVEDCSVTFVVQTCSNLSNLTLGGAICNRVSKHAGATILIANTTNRKDIML
jgi:hypothetical protein